jgi:hypothetical protein
MPEYPVREMKLFRNALYGTVDLGERPDKTRVSVTVKVSTGREDVTSALEPIKTILRREADRVIQESAVQDQVAEARLSAQKELAQRVVSHINRGAMPDDIAKSLKPIAGRA